MPTREAEPARLSWASIVAAALGVIALGLLLGSVLRPDDWLRLAVWAGVCAVVSLVFATLSLRE